MTITATLTPTTALLALAVALAWGTVIAAVWALLYAHGRNA